MKNIIPEAQKMLETITIWQQQMESTKVAFPKKTDKCVDIENMCVKAKQCIHTIKIISLDFELNQNYLHLKKQQHGTI